MSAAVPMENCSTEDLAAFLDGRLDDVARARVLEHITSCGECRDIVVIGTEIVATPGLLTEEVVPGRFPWRYVGPLVAAAAIAAVLFGVPQIREKLLGKEDMEVVVEAGNSLKKRTTEARLSGDFGYRDFPRMRGGNEDATIDQGPGEDEANSRLYTVGSKIQERVASKPSVADLHALGVVYILLKEHKPAIDTLERAAASGPPSAELLTDLAAAYSMAGDYQRALAYADRAWSLKQSHAAAWNRAIALQGLDRDKDAVAAWEKYLELDPNSPWADEARKTISPLQ